MAVLTEPILTVKRERPKLSADAFPSIFPNTPAYLSLEAARKRKAPDDRRLELSIRDEEQFQDWIAGDEINSFGDIDCKIDEFIKDS